MQLVVFDLDTALCQTGAMDGLAMASAIKDVADCQIGAESIHSIHDLKSIWYRATNRVATVSEISELRERFSFHLRRQFLIRPSVVSANYALVEQVNALQHRPKTIVGIVSSISAPVLLMKARAIGLISEAVPISTGEDSDGLEGILKTMQTRVKRSFGFHFGESQLIASDHWLSAAEATGMSHVLPSEYLTEHVAVNRENIFNKAASHFSWAR